MNMLESNILKSNVLKLNKNKFLFFDLINKFIVTLLIFEIKNEKEKFFKKKKRK